MLFWFDAHVWLLFGWPWQAVPTLTSSLSCWCWQVIGLLFRWVTVGLIDDGGTGYRQIQHLGPRESGTPIPDDRPRSSPQHSLRSHWRLIPNVWRAFISNSERPVIQSCSVLQQRRDHCLTRANLLRRLGARAGATQRPGDHCHITLGTLAVPCCLRATADRSDK